MIYDVCAFAYSRNSRSRYGKADKGHGPLLHYPDKTNSDVDKAMDMARQSFEELKKSAQNLKGCKCNGADSNPDWRKVRQFMEADGGNLTQDIKDLPQLLDNKRRILSDPRGRPLPRRQP